MTTSIAIVRSRCAQKPPPHKTFRVQAVSSAGLSRRCLGGGKRKYDATEFSGRKTRNQRYCGGSTGSLSGAGVSGTLSVGCGTAAIGMRSQFVEVKRAAAVR